MDSTPASLLERLREPGQEQAWACFLELYTPLLYHWARGQGLAEADAADLVQEVLLLLVRKLPEFHYERDGSFRQWLKTVTVNKWRELCRRWRPPTAPQELDELAARDESAALEEVEHRRHLVRQMLVILRQEFPASTWRLFEDYVIAKEEPEAVALRHGVSVGAVYAAKCKVMTRLRHELRGMLD